MAILLQMRVLNYESIDARNDDWTVSSTMMSKALLLGEGAADMDLTHDPSSNLQNYAMTDSEQIKGSKYLISICYCRTGNDRWVGSEYVETSVETVGS